MVEGALVKIFVKKTSRLKVEERLWIDFRYITSKQTPLTYLKNILNLVSVYICLQANKYVHWENEWSFNIYRECWKQIIAFQTKNTPENTFILFIFCVCTLSFGEKKKNENTANAAVKLKRFLILIKIGRIMN